MPNALEICRICMSVNIKMFTLINTNMENLYNLLTHVYVDTEDGKPTTVCFLCYARLRQCDRLQQQAIKSNELLEQLLKGGFMQTTATAILNGQYNSQDLQVSSTYYLDLEPANCKEVLLNPKVEANDLISVKKEVEAIDVGCNVTENLYLIRQEKEVESDPHPSNATLIQQSDKTSYDNDEVKETITEEFKCNECGKQFATEDIATDHTLKCMNTTGNFVRGDHLTKADTLKSLLSKIYSCGKCLFKTYDKCIIETHFKTHNVTKILYCNICEYRCARESHLKSHMRKHTGEKPFSCNICEYRCSQKNNLKDHMRTHTGEKPFSCNICEYRCARKPQLMRHVKIHSGEKLFSCNICEYRCADKSSLKKHLKKHTGEKPLSCNICEYKFAYKSHLIEHIRTHTGEKPFSCIICEYRCTYKSNLKQHIRKHTGEKPFSCNICDYRCAHRYGLKVHMKKHTSE